MDGSNPSANAISGDIAPYICHCGCDSEIDYKESIYSLGEKHVVSSTIGEKDGQQPDGTRCLHEVEKLDQQEDIICQEFLHSVSLDVNKQKTLRKSATFPCSLDIQLDTGNRPSSGEEERSSADNAVYAHSVSLPTVRIVSAMKGSRERSGLVLDTKLHVKWAPDVYDPPITLMSHIVRKNHHQRSKPKKKDNSKHKRNKTKTSRGTTKKIANNSDLSRMVEPLDLRLEKEGNRPTITDMSNLKNSWNMELPFRNQNAEVAF